MIYKNNIILYTQCLLLLISFFIVSPGNAQGRVNPDSSSKVLPSKNTLANLSGKVSYDNTASTPITNCIVYLKQGDSVYTETTTDNEGKFAFFYLPYGIYNFDIMLTLAWGGINSSDAYLITKHYDGTIPLSGLALKAADVNLDTRINKADALLVSKRFANVINSFPAGDWVNNQPTVNFNGPGVKAIQIKVLCTGDVNRSPIP